MESIEWIAETPEDAMPRDEVIDWVNQLAAGDAAAAQTLWERYFGKLVRLAARRLGDSVRFDKQPPVIMSGENQPVRHGSKDLFPSFAAIRRSLEEPEIDHRCRILGPNSV